MRDEASVPFDDFTDASAIGGEKIVQILRIERAERAVEPTRSQNMIVTWRRSTAGARSPAGAAAEGSAPVCSIAWPSAGSCRAPSPPIASISLRRCPTDATPISCRSATVNSGSVSASM
jgi:hypothetical protein